MRKLVVYSSTRGEIVIFINDDDTACFDPKYTHLKAMIGV